MMMMMMMMATPTLVTDLTIDPLIY